MLPTVLLIGCFVGFTVGEQRPARHATALVAVALMWGMAVGIGAGSVTAFAGGAALAALNAVAGAAIGIALRRASTLARHLLPRR